MLHPPLCRARRTHAETTTPLRCLLSLLRNGVLGPSRDKPAVIVLWLYRDCPAGIALLLFCVLNCVLHFPSCSSFFSNPFCICRPVLLSREGILRWCGGLLSGLNLALSCSIFIVCTVGDSSAFQLSSLSKHEPRLQPVSLNCLERF